MNKNKDRTTQYRKDSLTLVGAVALGTGVMIGAGIFALTGQMAQMTGSLFPLAFLSAAVIVTFSAYSYVKMSNAYPSAGGIGMYLKKAYGSTVTPALHAPKDTTTNEAKQMNRAFLYFIPGFLNQVWNY